MEQFGVLIGLIGIMFVCIIGVYGWTFAVQRSTDRQIAKVLLLVNEHLQNADIHGKNSRFVSIEVCEAIHTALKEGITEMKGDLIEIKGDMKKVLAKG
tara:strand:+ start:231 stop:524 length:294 start_codon:yes stop_codon:yes gene_type:complete